MRLRAEEDIVIRSNPETYRMTIEMGTLCGDRKPEELAIVLPMAESDAYQDIQSQQEPPSASVAVIPETGDKYFIVRYSGKDLEGERTPASRYELLATLYDIRVDFSRIRQIVPYRKDDNYARYTSRSGEYILPKHPRIVAIARNIAGEATDSVDFARRAYEYVAKRYRHFSNTGFRPLEKALRNGGGHCGELSAIYISILRSAGIPARHLTGHLSNGKTHIISEFYIEDYGWIPVDVDSRSLKPEKDFFGNIPKESMPITISRGMHLTLDDSLGNTKVPSLQRGWAWWEPRDADVKRTFAVHCEKAH